MQRGLCAYKMANKLPRLTCRFKDCISFHGHILFRHSVTVPSKYASTLVLSGRKAREKFAYLNPYIDFDNTLSDIDQFQEEVELRGLNISMFEMGKMWDTYKKAYLLMQDLTAKKLNLLERLKELKEHLTEDDNEKLTALLKEIKIISAECKNAQDKLWELQDTALVNLFKLPNRLDANTPTVSKVLATYGDLNNVQDLNTKNHIEIGKDLGLLEYRDPIQYYLCDDAVLFELGVLEYAADIFNSKNMFRMAGCDFSRSVVVEGVGINHEDPWETFILTNDDETGKRDPNKLHLMGGASMFSMLTMFTKALVNKNSFPIRCFSTGRQYTPYPDSSIQNGLFVACQASIAQVLVAVNNPNSDEYQNTFDELVQISSQLYNDICDHYRVVMRSASELKHNECKRVSFELWSPHARKYVEVGHIASYGDYISKRLLMSYRRGKQTYFPGIISGTVLSVPRLLACLLESSPDRFKIPEKIRATSMFTAYNDTCTDSVK